MVNKSRNINRKRPDFIGYDYLAFIRVGWFNHIIIHENNPEISDIKFERISFSERRDSLLQQILQRYDVSCCLRC